ncbi:aldo/keto reductase [Chloroflexota bacterium]
MKTRFLGKSGIKVSELCFGTMTFGGRGRHKRIGEVSQKEADTLVGIALDAGINFFDTADVYSEGLSEEICGKALGSRRKDVILGTKVRARMGSGPNDVGLSRHHILEGCDASLRRLGTDYIDLYQVHSFDPITPLEETLRALDDLVRQGKVRYIGCSNFAGWHLMKALSISEKYGWERLVSFQGRYSLVERDLEYDLLPLCLDQELGILAYGTLGGGFLSGKYQREQPRPKGTRFSDSGAGTLPFDEEKGFDIVKQLGQISKEHDATIAQTAINYILHKPGITSVLIGTRTSEQLVKNLKTTDWELTQAEIARLDELTQPFPIYPHQLIASNVHGR